MNKEDNLSRLFVFQQSSKGEEFMNKKEVLEVRKQFSPSHCGITRICGCYVDYEKNIRFRSKDSFLSLPEEEAYKYFDLFKKTLSGTIGKNLLNLNFPLEQEMEGGTADFLYRLRNSRLEDDTLLEEFYSRVIEHYESADNYYVVLIHGMYDIPGKGTDNIQVYDASENVYEYILMSINPVSLSEPGLGYDPEVNRIQGRSRDWLVEGPGAGFLYPAFNDRNQDIHSLLYYMKNPDQLQNNFIKEVFGVENLITAKLEREIFQAIVEDSFGDQRDFTTVRNVYEELNDVILENKGNPEPVVLEENDVKIIFERSGMNESQAEDFQRSFQVIKSTLPNFHADNVIDSRKFEVSSPNVVIKVNPERTDLVETRIIDGRKCLVITVDDFVEVNGIRVNTI